MESPVQVLDRIHRAIAEVEHTVCHFSISDIHLKRNPVAILSIEQREVKSREMGESLFNLSDVRRRWWEWFVFRAECGNEAR